MTKIKLPDTSDAEVEYELYTLWDNLPEQVRCQYTVNLISKAGVELGLLSFPTSRSTFMSEAKLKRTANNCLDYY